MSPRRDAPVVLLATDGPLTRIMFHALADRFDQVTVVFEEPVSKVELLRRRRARLGLLTVAGQVLFMAAAAPLLQRAARRRIDEIKQAERLDDSPVPEHLTVRLTTANSEECRAILRRLAPAVVVVSGTRILSGETIRSIEAPFVNLHMGTTPMYRGVHGGYWALADGRPELAGSTVHLIDDGIDTGRILEQRPFTPAPADSFATYPYLHLATSLEALLAAVERASAGDISGPGPIRQDLPSGLRSHPTLWGYLHRRIKGTAR